MRKSLLLIIILFLIIIPCVIAAQSIPTSLSELKAYRSTFQNIKYDAAASMKVGGVQYDKGVKVEGFSGTAYFNLNGDYSRLIGRVGLDDETPSDAITSISFEEDGKLLQSIKVNPGDLPVNVSLDVSGVHVLTITMPNGYRYTSGDLIDMALGPAV